MSLTMFLARLLVTLQKEEKEKNDKMNTKKATEINSGSEIKTVDSVGAYGLNKSVQKQ